MTLVGEMIVIYFPCMFRLLQLYYQSQENRLFLCSIMKAVRIPDSKNFNKRDNAAITDKVCVPIVFLPPPPLFERKQIRVLHNISFFFQYTYYKCIIHVYGHALLLLVVCRLSSRSAPWCCHQPLTMQYHRYRHIKLQRSPQRVNQNVWPANNV